MYSRRCFFALVFVAVLLLVQHAPDAGAIELPLRELILGGEPHISLRSALACENTLIQYEYRYLDLYRMKGPGEQHDYHCNDFLFTGIQRRGRFWYGVTGRAGSLVLANENVYTRADRLHGGGDRIGGGMLFGIAAGRGLPLLRNSATDVQCSIGWDEGLSGSLEAELRWRGERRFSVRGWSGARRFDFTQEIGGYAFPFPFSFRESGVHAELEMPIGPLRIAPRCSWEVGSGDEDEEARFSNRLFFGMASIGVSLQIHPGGQLSGEAGSDPRREPTGVPGMYISIDHHRCKVDIGMYDRGTRYLHLDDLFLTDTVAEFGVMIHRGGRLFCGWERLGVEHAGNTFFDTWPFDIWDVFAARRYRLGEIDGYLDTWFVGAGSAFDCGPCRIHLRGRWEWWRDEGALRWLEREDVFFPFAFKYIPHDEELDLTPRFAIQLDPSVSIHIGRSIVVHLSGTAAVPFGRDRDGTAPASAPAPPAPKEDVTRHGGLTGRVVITYSR